ncbi:MAG: chain length-determining protein [Azoarcus sp.]|jgi:polysaccharide chain length determinant protein (PEP-CTERM system associated)|nr:chain length-determining protein [Azoarcus sp.]
MEELLGQVVGYLRGMWRFRWWGLGFTWVVGVIGCGVVYTMPDKYESSARVFVDTRSLLNSVVTKAGGGEANYDQRVQVLGKTLITRPNMEKLIEKSDLDFTLDAPDPRAREEQRDALVEHLLSTIEVRASTRDNIYTISYVDTKPSRARRVVSELMSLFVESGLDDKQSDARKTRVFLEEQINIYKQKLVEAENRRKQFELDNLNMAKGSEGGFVGRLADITSKLAAARLALSQAEGERDALYKQTGASQGQEWVPGLDEQIAGLKNKITDLKLRYTDEHPEVREAKRVLADMQLRRAETLEEMRRSGTSAPGADAANPAFIQLKMELGKADAKVATAGLLVDNLERQSAIARESAKTQLEAENTLADMNRNYGLDKQKYEQFSKDLQNLDVTDRPEVTGSAIGFKVFEPANLPIQPSAPNRLLLMPLVGVLSLVVGMALTFLISQFRPSFMDTHTLRDVLGLPVLGVVTMLVSSGRRRRHTKGLYAFGSGVASFVVCIALATLALNSFRH